MGRLLGEKVMSLAHLRNHGCPLYNYVANMMAYMLHLYRASDISRGRGPEKFRYFRQNPAKFPKKREITRNPPKIFPNTCRQNIFNAYLGY